MYHNILLKINFGLRVIFILDYTDKSSLGEIYDQNIIIMKNNEDCS